jgi:hypothetical protein
MLETVKSHYALRVRNHNSLLYTALITVPRKKDT